MIGRRGAALVAVVAMACADDPPNVYRAPVDLPASPEAAFARGLSVALVTVADAGTPRTVDVSPEARVSMDVFGATAARAAQPSGVRAIAAGSRVVLDVHVAIAQIDASGRIIGRIDNPFDDASGRARFTTGRRLLVTLAPDGDAAWRVWDAFQVGTSGDVLAEPALGFAPGTTLDALFAALRPP